ncbi:MAG TPA: hypothetical protein VG797_03265 [Phycisphaerales bacterium]|nr:hypothetical protein [Phycisphaerales bacterium]
MLVLKLAIGDAHRQRPAFSPAPSRMDSGFTCPIHADLRVIPDMPATKTSVCKGFPFRGLRRLSPSSGPFRLLPSLDAFERPSTGLQTPIAPLPMLAPVLPIADSQRQRSAFSPAPSRMDSGFTCPNHSDLRVIPDMPATKTIVRKGLPFRNLRRLSPSSGPFRFLPSLDALDDRLAGIPQRASHDMEAAVHTHKMPSF